MRKFKLNKKGFTLIELLAIIVILAIILVITVPQVFDAVDSSKRTSLVNSSKGLAQWFATTVTSDALSTYDDGKVIKSDNENIDLGTTWECITDDTAELAEISKTDYNINTSLSSTIGASDTAQAKSGELVAVGNCSMIRKNANNRYEVILVAHKDGKLYIGNGSTSFWAASDGTTSW